MLSLSLSQALSLSLSLSLAIITNLPIQTPRSPSSFVYHVFVTFLSLSINMSGNLPFSHETVVHSLMREAVVWSQTIRNRTCFMVKLNHTAYWRMAIQAPTNSSVPLKIWDHPLQCQHFVRYVSVEQYFSAAVLLSISESWSPLTLPIFAAKGNRCVASSQSMDAQQSFWTITMMITTLLRQLGDHAQKGDAQKRT